MDGKLENVKKNPGFFFTALVCMMCLMSLLANVIVTLVAPVQLGIFRVSAGFFLFPLVFIISDITSEVYGFHRSRKLSYMVMFVNLFASALFFLVYIVVGPEKAAGLERLAKASWWITLISALSFQVGNYVNDVIFQAIRRYGGKRFFWIRTVVSSVGAEIVDCGFFVGFGLVVLYNIPFKGFLLIWGSQVLFKLLVEVVLLPVTYQARKIAFSFDPDVFYHPKSFNPFGGGVDPDQSAKNIFDKKGK